jgi:hypothetical protein
MKRSIIFLRLSLFVFFGGVFGFMIGIWVINFFPDKCTTEGITTICQNSFKFMGLAGWIGTSFLGLIIGASIGLAIYFTLIHRKNLKHFT